MAQWELKKRWRKPSGFDPRRPHNQPDQQKYNDVDGNDKAVSSAGERPVHILLTFSLAAVIPAAFAWYAPPAWLQAASYVVVPLGLLLLAGLARWAYLLRDEDAGWGGDGGPEVTPWAPDPGGLEIDLAFWELVIAETDRLNAENARLADELRDAS